MKTSYPWNYRRILADDKQAEVEAASPFTDAVEAFLEERRRALRIVRYGSAGLLAVFALTCIFIGRLSVPTIGPDSVLPINPEGATAMQLRFEALAQENATLINELQQAQSAVEDLEDLAARHQASRSPQATPGLQVDSSLATITDRNQPAGS